MATLAELMDAVAYQLDSVLSQVTDVTIHIEPRAFKAAELPAIDMYPVAPTLMIDQLGGFGELVASGWPINIRVRVSPGDVYAGEDLLLAFMDDEDDLSIMAALDEDHQLGGIATDIRWGDWAGFIDFPAPDDRGGSFLGSVLPLVIIKAYS